MDRSRHSIAFRKILGGALIPLGLGAAVVAAGLALLAAVYLITYPVSRLAPEAAASLELLDRNGNLLRSPLRGGAAGHLDSVWARWRRR